THSPPREYRPRECRVPGTARGPAAAPPVGPPRRAGFSARTCTRDAPSPAAALRERTVTRLRRSATPLRQRGRAAPGGKDMAEIWHPDDEGGSATGPASHPPQWRGEQMKKYSTASLCVMTGILTFICMLAALTSFRLGSL